VSQSPFTPPEMEERWEPEDSWVFVLLVLLVTIIVAFGVGWFMFA
jgi:hypothetical protein